MNKSLGTKEGQIILAGDLNQVMEPVTDQSKFQILLVLMDRDTLHILTEDLGLLDIWWLVNPCEKECTFFSHRHKSYFKIDFFLLSKSITEQVIDSKIGLII